MTEDLDAGPIFVQRATPVTDETYIRDVYKAARQVVPELFMKTLDGIETGELSPTPQSDDPDDALRCYPRKPIDSRIDWEASAESIHRIVRASAEPLFGAFTYYGTDRLRVWRAFPEAPSTPFLATPGQVAERRPSEGTVAVITGDGFLVLEEVELEGGRRRPAAEVLTSNRDRLGITVVDALEDADGV
jgi:methionyl-tRNA formyltransferase